MIATTQNAVATAGARSIDHQRELATLSSNQSKLEHGHKRYPSRRTASNLGGKTQIPSLGLMELYTINVVVENIDFAECSPGHCHHQRSSLVDQEAINPPNGKIVGFTSADRTLLFLGQSMYHGAANLLETTFIPRWLGSPATPVEHKTEI